MSARGVIGMVVNRAASTGKLERAVARYRTKLAAAANPTQRRYAASMLRMAERALADAASVGPAGGREVVTLHPSEYSVADG